MPSLTGKKVAIVVADGFEEIELTGPRDLLEQAGARTVLISLASGKVRGFKHHDPADKFAVDLTIASANPDDYDALLLPGGVMNPDQLRVVPDVLRFVRAFGEAGKPIAAICHGPWTLIDAGLVKGKRMTSWPTLKTDLTNAGALWVDEACVVDENLVTSRKPDDIRVFSRKLIEMIAASKPAKAPSQAAARPNHY